MISRDEILEVVDAIMAVLDEHAEISLADAAEHVIDHLVEAELELNGD